ncbi:hypothetical protein ABZY58_12095 [Micromonospora tulbaghiae]|uniref:hypothetical protein n=1 Tax=Micromonospora tulbaghiae TaxID=479978 RepID=UPI0033A866BB
MSETTCQHGVKWRLVGSDPRLWQCDGDTNLNDPGCGALFVEGRTSEGEQRWLPLGVSSRSDISCGVCLDGFCTLLDHRDCTVSGRSTARPVAVAYQEKLRQETVLRGGMPGMNEASV